MRASFSLSLCLLLCSAPLLCRAEEEATATRDASSDGKPEEPAGHYLEPKADVLSDKGEVPLDPASGAKLPEEMDDGELEGGDHHTGWTYLNQRLWDHEYPQCNSKNMRQSPVDIVTSDVRFEPAMQLSFVDYKQEVEFEFKNTHHSVSLTPISSLATPSLRLNWVGEREQLYELQEIHFHWGDGLNKGSEHEVNDKRAAAEMHMVHYRKGLNKSQIGSVENSVVVLGVFIESDDVEHNKLEALVRRTERVNGTDLEYKDDNPENLINLLPENHHSFYTYNGSLTTPPCYQVVTWVIMSEPVFMSQEKLVELSNFELYAGPAGGRKKIASNYRDIQPLLERPVYASFNASDSSTYELRSEFPMKRIGGHRGHFSRAIEEYWRGVNKLRVSVRHAYGALQSARQRLLRRLGKKDKPTAPAPEPAGKDQ